MNESEHDQNMEKKCPQCGSSLPTGALEGLCPACLLKQGAAAETGTNPRSAPFVPPSVQEIAALFPQLEILSLLGRGGMGAVYKARQPALDRVVALKILPPQAASGPGFPERFNREARSLARLNHPNIVVVHEFGQVSGMPFFIMEFVDGLNLRQLEQAGRVSSREALQIIPQICAALQFAHDAGIVHRDVKPENILIDKTGRVKIADFGIAKIMGAEAEGEPSAETKQAIGTPHYMAPEQIEKPETVDHRADIYSLGVVFYEMLTGELPLGKFAPPSSRVRVDVRLDEVVLRALEKEPEMRFQQVREVTTRLETIASAAPPLTPADVEALSREILAKDYSLDIGSCLSRGWALVKQDFWPTVGVTAIMLILLQAVSILGGPLMGGLLLFYLKKVRVERANIDTAFSGFRLALLPLFLGGLVTGLLTIVASFCFLLPGIYLMVAWMFTLSLVIDKRLDFWPAMQLSRKLVNKHFWKLLELWLVLALVSLSGAILCGVGTFLTVPIALAALMYAYNDIFGGAQGTPAAPPPLTGPTGTAVMPGAPSTPRGGSGIWKPLGIGLAALILLFLVVAVGIGRHRNRLMEREMFNNRAQVVPSEPTQPEVTVTNYVFGRLIERTVNDPDDDTHNSCLDLDSGKLSDLTMPWPEATATEEAFSNAWVSLTPVVIQQGVDVMSSASGHSLETFLGAALAVSNEVFETISPADLASDEELGRRAAQGEAAEARETLAIANTPATYLFKTRAGNQGIMQIKAFAESPRGVKIRYKLLQTQLSAAPADGGKRLKDDLSARLDAAADISNPNAKDEALAAVAMQAAKAGQVDLARRAIDRMYDIVRKDVMARGVSEQLAKRGLRRQAIEIAKTISNPNVRDAALAELAR